MSLKCYHENEDFPRGGDFGKCELTHEKCKSCPDDCVYYRIYEDAYNEGYANGCAGEDL